MKIGEVFNNNIKRLIAFLKDRSSLQLVTQGMGIAYKVSKLTSLATASYQPYLILLPALFYLPSSLKASRDQMKNVIEAIKVRRYAESLFWSGRSIDAIGSFLGNISKTTIGTMEVAGIPPGPGMNTLFSRYLPVILMGTSVVGGLTHGWALLRTAKALKRFNQKSQEGRLEFLDEFFSFDKKTKAEQTAFISDHFSCESSYLEIKERLLAMMDTLSQSKLPENIRMAHQDAFTFLKREGQWTPTDIYTAIDLYDQLISQYKSQPEIHQSLVDCKDQLESEITTLFHMTRSELHHRLFLHAVIILSASLGLITGSLMYSSMDFHVVASVLGISSAMIDMGLILFEKKFKGEKFLNLEKALCQKFFELKWERIRPPGLAPIWWLEKLETPAPSLSAI